MKTKITMELLKCLKPQEKPYDVRDTVTKGLLVRVNKSGKLVYMCEYGRGKRIMVGIVGSTSLKMARLQAEKIVANAIIGTSPSDAHNLTRTKKRSTDMTLRQFVEKEYESWVLSNNQSGKETLVTLKNRFCKPFGDTPLNDLTLHSIEKWRVERLKTTKAETINRNITALSSALNKVKAWELLKQNPISGMTPLPINQDPIVRYLEPAEEKRLRNALAQRNKALISARERTNAHRNARKLPCLPDLSQASYGDYLYPMALLAMNTGIRRGEMFRLTWQDVNFNKRLLIAKSRKTKRHTYKIRHIPLNSEALTALQAWRQQCDKTHSFIFINDETREPFTTIKKSWGALRKQAKLTNFRWHDFRHHFASRLVMSGSDLNTVRELLGHADIKMTLRYAHLAPSHKADAVERLVKHSEEG